MATSGSVVNYPDLGEQVYGIIRDQILTVHLAPGSPLPVVELARQLGVSRTPVTDALNLLTAEGLVENVPRKGYYVAKLDVEDYLDVLDARLAIELASAERGIATVDPEMLDRMRRQNDHMRSCVGPEGELVDFVEWMNRDFQFHSLLVSLARNRRLSEMHARLSAHGHIARVHFSSAVGHRPTVETLTEHEAILSALAAADLAGLKEAIADHIRRSTRFYSAGIRER